VTLLNVTVVDSSAAGTVLSGVTLAPNASTNYSGSYTATGCGPFTNVVTAPATTVRGHSGVLPGHRGLHDRHFTEHYRLTKAV